MTPVLHALLAAVLTGVLILWLRHPAARIGLVDLPGGRKRHAGVIPLTGGLAVALGFVAALAMTAPSLAAYQVLLVALAALAIVGLVDDIGEVPARTKLAMQVVAAVLMTVWGEHALHSLGDLTGSGPVLLGPAAVPFTVFATVAVINGINMLDGLDGLAGGVVLVILSFFTVLAISSGNAVAAIPLALLVGAVGGFLLFNAPHPWRGAYRVFMGDTGSLVLGFVVVWFAIALTQTEQAPVSPVVMLWIVGLVLFDLFTVTVRRLLRRRDPMNPDRAHIHHVLMRRGYTELQALLILVAGNAVLGGIGVLAWSMGMPDALLFFGFLAIGLVYFSLLLFPLRLLRRPRAPSADPRSGAPIELTDATAPLDVRRR